MTCTVPPSTSGSARSPWARCSLKAGGAEPLLQDALGASELSWLSGAFHLAFVSPALSF